MVAGNVHVLHVGFGLSELKIVQIGTTCPVHGKTECGADATYSWIKVSQFKDGPGRYRRAWNCGIGDVIPSRDSSRAAGSKREASIVWERIDGVDGERGFIERCSSGAG